MKNEYHVVSIPIKLTPEMLEHEGDPPHWATENSLTRWRLVCALFNGGEEFGIDPTTIGFESTQVDEGFYNHMGSDTWEEKIKQLLVHDLLGNLRASMEEDKECMAHIDAVIKSASRYYGVLPDDVTLPPRWWQ
jgi:hypothetical protein